MQPGILHNLTPDQIVADAEWAIATLERLGVPVPGGARIRQALADYQRAGLILIPAGVRLPDRDLRLTEAVRTIFEHERIVRHVVQSGRSTSAWWIDKLRKMTLGAPIPVDGAHDLGRNTEAELFTATFLECAGYECGMSETPDFRLSGNGFRDVGLEVKRVSGEGSYGSRIREAKRQIGQSAIPGLIVLSIDRYMNRVEVVGAGAVEDVFAGKARALFRKGWARAENSLVIGMLVMATSVRAYDRRGFASAHCTSIVHARSAWYVQPGVDPAVYAAGRSVPARLSSATYTLLQPRHREVA